ncbi:MAG: hypothetical protein RR490_06940, partial [Niameybacter sp.]
KSSSGLSMREKLIRRKKELEKRGSGGGIIFPKEGTIRFRIKDPGEDSELAIEILQVYLGPKLGGIISPATFGEPCPFMEKYQELKKSKDDDDLETAKKLTPKHKYVCGIVGYKDEKGKEVDPDRVDKLLMIPKNAYQDIIDLYLDEDEWGDMTSAKNGYDIKLNRTGKGQLDTTYTVSPCQKKPLDKKFAKPMDVEAELRKHIPSYEELEEKLEEFLCGGVDDEDDDEPKKKKKKLGDKDKGKKKKKKGSDI